MNLSSVRRGFLFSCAVLAVALVAGCAHIDIAPAGNPERVLRGTVNFRGAVPGNAEVLVRLLEQTTNDTARAVASDSPARPQGGLAQSERVLGEFRDRVPSGALQPLAFEIPYTAEDFVLRRGLNIDVRVSVGGKVRMRTVTVHVVTLTTAPYKQEVWVQAID